MSWIMDEVRLLYKVSDKFLFAKFSFCNTMIDFDIVRSWC